MFCFLAGSTLKKSAGAPDEGGPIRSEEEALKVSFATGFVITALALAIWVFFYLVSAPLTAPETTVVVGLCAAVVLSGKWIWARLRKTRGKNE